MAGTMTLFKTQFKKSTDLLIKNGFCFSKLFVVFFIPILIWYFGYADNQKFIRMIIDQFTLPGFVLIDDAMNFIVFVYFLLYSVAIVQSIHAVVRGGNPGVIMSYRKAFDIFGSYLWVKILSLFKILCWSLLFIIPGAVKGVYYNFSGMALLIDGKNGKEALIQSQKAIKPNVLKYLASCFLVATILVIACILVTFNLNTAVTLFMLNGKTLLARVVICGEIGLYALALSFFLTFYYYLYVELSEGVER